MNETQLPDPKLDDDAPENTPEKRASLGNRILGYSFLASVVINLGWLAWVSSSNLFGGKAPLDLHPQVIKMVKIPQKPKPKPLKKVPPPPPPPPPKQKPPPPLKTPPKIRPKTPPKIQPRVQPKAQPKTPPKVQPHPTPPRTAPPVQSHPVSVAKSTRSVSNVPAINTGPPTDNQKPFDPGPTTTTGGTQKPAEQPKVEQPKVEQPKVEEKPKVEEQPKVVKQDPPKPPGWVPIDARPASDVQSVDVSADDIDSGSISSNEIVISYTIDETGHIKNARVKKSCGNSDLDNRVLQAVQRQRCAPAIQDHIPRESHEEFHFPVNS